MKQWKLVIALLSALALFATACGSDATDVVSDAAESVVETTEDAAEAVTDAVTDDDDAMEEDSMEDEDAMEDEEAMEEEEDPAPAASGGAEGGELLLLQWQAPSQANAHLSSGSKDVLASSLALEPLANITPEGEIVARLAAEVPTLGNGGISEDLTQITWTLQDGIMWSDGSPFTAADVVFTYEFCADELTGCTTADSIADVASVVAIDDLTVEITFNGPTPYPFEPFVGHSTPILQAAQFADCIGEGASACSDQNFRPIGTGPFVITDLRPEDTVVAEANPMYRDYAEGKPYFSSVVIKGGGDAEAAARSVLEIGEADYAWNLQVAPEILAPMEAAGQGSVEVAFTSSVEHINLNQANNRAEDDTASDWLEGANPHPILFQNLDLVRALSLAIDRDLLVQVGYGANGRPTCNMWNVGVQNSTSQDWCLTRDVDQANQILDDAGFADTDGDGVRETPDGLPLSFDYVTSTNAVRQSNQEIIKANWAEIGVDVNMKNEDASLFFDGTNADVSIWRFPSDMEMFTNLPNTPEPTAYLGGWTKENIPTLENAWGGSNMPRQQSDEFDSLIDELSTTPLDDPGRNDLAIRANDILSFEGGAIIPLILRGSVSAFSNAIDGVGPLNGWDSEYWNIAEWIRTS